MSKLYVLCKDLGDNEEHIAPFDKVTLERKFDEVMVYDIRGKSFIGRLKTLLTEEEVQGVVRSWFDEHPGGGYGKMEFSDEVSFVC